MYKQTCIPGWKIQILYIRTSVFAPGDAAAVVGRAVVVGNVAVAGYAAAAESGNFAEEGGRSGCLSVAELEVSVGPEALVEVEG